MKIFDLYYFLAMRKLFPNTPKLSINMRKRLNRNLCKISKIKVEQR
jgi:hypothetical protein